MFKPFHKQTLIFVCIFILVLITLYAVKSYSLKFRPHVKSIHVINLDKDTARWEAIQRSTIAVRLPVERWSATYGREFTQEELAELGIGYAMTRSGKGSYDEQGKDLRNQGVVGCYLSHRNLLEHLSTLDVPDYYGHLILEDDVQVPPNFLHPDDDWHQVYKTVPMDWDMVYLDITKPVGYTVAPQVKRLKYKIGVEGGNWGTHSYIVRHGAIKDKILPWLEYMIDAIDEQYKMKFGSWKVYAVVPGIMQLDPQQSAVSSITKN